MGGAISATAYYYWKLHKTEKQLKIEKVKSHELAKKLKLALHTINEHERNPDLIHSREFNLDYLSMRMEEPHFCDVILAQIKVNLRQKVAPALMPTAADSGQVRKVDVVFDVSNQNTMMIRSSVFSFASMSSYRKFLPMVHTVFSRSWKLA